MRERLHDLSPFEQEPGKAHKTSRHLAVKKVSATWQGLSFRPIQGLDP